MATLKFVTSRNFEIDLAPPHTEQGIWEIYGRTGFEAPPVEFVDEPYADGYVETIAVRMQPRDATLHMIVRGQSTLERDNTLHPIVNQLLEHGARTGWGKLYIDKSDGTIVYLNCFYSGGLESQSEDDPLMHKFSLSFHAADPHFYEQDWTGVIFSDTEQDGLYLSDTTFLSDMTFLSGGIQSSETIVKNMGQLAYPVITVHGPAKNIKFENQHNGVKIELEEGFILATGETLTITCLDRKRSILLKNTAGVESDITNKLRRGSSLVFPILHGNNYIKITYTDTNAMTYVNFAFQQRYLSA